MDYQKLRDHMVNSQLIARGIKDSRVLEAMRRVPRHLFVLESELHRAYDDYALPIGFGQTISQPYMVAVMTELLDLKGTEKVLEIGTGSGYQAAVLSELSRQVYSIERIAELTEFARSNLDSAGYQDVKLKTYDGSEGWLDEAPFDRIVVTAATPEFPSPLVDQLVDEGIGIAPVGPRFSQQLLRIMKRGGKTTESYFTPCVFVPLVGRYGWEK